MAELLGALMAILAGLGGAALIVRTWPDRVIAVGDWVLRRWSK